MKNSLIIVLLVGLFFSGCVDETMIKTIKINASAEQVWNAIAFDLNNWGKLCL